MNKLELKGERRKYAGKHQDGRRFYTSLDMAIVKHDQARVNAEVKRGTRQRSEVAGIYPCGCGREGCFIHRP